MHVQEAERVLTFHFRAGSLGGGQVAVQAVDGIRTVTSFNLSGRIMTIYSQELQSPLQEGVRRGLVDGVSLGLSQLITLGAYGFVFWCVCKGQGGRGLGVLFARPFP